MSNKPNWVKLGEVPAGGMFRRSEGGYRYAKSQEFNYSRDEVWCYNIDGESVGYYHRLDEKVVVEDPTRARARPEPKTFFMCYVDGGNLPAVRHHDETLAGTEAERLARSTEKRVFILQALSCVEYNPPQDNLFIWINL